MVNAFTNLQTSAALAAIAKWCWSQLTAIDSAATTNTTATTRYGMIKLVINNPKPVPTDRNRLLAAIIRRAVMTDENAHASFYGDIEIKKKKVKP
jgi:hypothetical protein